MLKSALKFIAVMVGVWAVMLVAASFFPFLQNTFFALATYIIPFISAFFAVKKKGKGQRNINKPEEISNVHISQKDADNSQVHAPDERKFVFCKKCGQEIREDAKFCPYCSTPTSMKEDHSDRKVHKPIYKRWWFWLIAVILLLGIFGNGEGSTPETTTPTESIVDYQQEEPDTTETEYSTEIPPEVTSEIPTVENTETTEATTIPETVPTEVPTEEPLETIIATEAPKVRYILNTSSMKFHNPSCSSAKKIGVNNRWEFTGTRDEVIAMGYDSCGRCHP